MSDTGPRIVIAAYRPKPGREGVLLSEVRDHHPLLRSEGLATDRAPTIMRAADGTVLEVFEWASVAAIAQAHENLRVQAMWARFASCSDYVPVGTLPEATDLFAEFEALELDFPPVPRATPEQREE